MNYWLNFKDKNLNVYSCDMLRVTFEMRRDCATSIGHHFTNVLRSDIKEYPMNFTEFKFKHLFSISCGESSAIVGLCFNGANRDDALKGFFEFNPNKCMHSLQLQRDLSFILSRCSDYAVKRWDLAIDVPYNREYVHMTKDNRKYELSQTSFVNRTEYLGQRNAPGRVKVYNKTAESNLEYALTRVEITMGNLNSYLSDFEKYVPEIWIDGFQRELVDYTGLSNTQCVLCDLLRESPNPEYFLNRLDYRVRKKIEPYVIGSDARLDFDLNCVSAIVADIREYLNNLVVHIPEFDTENYEKDNPFL